MLTLTAIDRIARLRRAELDRDVSSTYRMRSSLSQVHCPDEEHLDLNIRLVLQPRLSLSIWFGRGAR